MHHRIIRGLCWVKCRLLYISIIIIIIILLELGFLNSLLCYHGGYNIIRFYKGEGSWPQNYAVASEYYKLAAAEDYQPAKERLDQLAALEAQKEAAKAAAAESAMKRKPWQFWTMFGGGGRRKPAATV